MITFGILSIVLLIIAVIAIAIIFMYGAGLIVVYADWIVCGLIIGWLLMRLFKKRK